MKEKPRKEVHYGKETWVNPTTESLRKNECLCLHCENLKLSQKSQEDYQMTIKINDLVCMPDGITFGIITSCEILVGGNTKRVKVYPFATLFRRFILKTVFYDGEINNLKLIVRPNPDKSSNCPYANQLYKTCVDGDIALIITRCKQWKPKP